MIAFYWPRQHAGLLLQMAQRDILQRYRGSWLGMGWAIITPILMLVVYSFVFQSVFQARWPGAETSESDGLYFALNLFAGLIFFTFFADVITRSPGIITTQPNLVKKVVFPLHLLPWIVILSSGFQALISLVVLSVGVFLMTGSLPENFLYLPLLLLLFVPLLLGLALGLSALGVYFTDAQHIVTILTAPLMFLSPVFYPVSMLPEWAQEWIYLNPLTLIIEFSRTVFLGSAWPDLFSLGVYGFLSFLTALLGGLLFKKLRRGFSDVL